MWSELFSSRTSAAAARLSLAYGKDALAGLDLRSQRIVLRRSLSWTFLVPPRLEACIRSGRYSPPSEKTAGMEFHQTHNVALIVQLIVAALSAFSSSRKASSSSYTFSIDDG